MGANWRVGETRFLGLTGWQARLAATAILVALAGGAAGVLIVFGVQWIGAVVLAIGVLMVTAWFWMSEWWGLAWLMASREADREARRHKR